MFILALVSLMALLSASYVRSIIESSWNLHGYFKAYYLAKWWIESSLVILKEYDVGMEFSWTWSNDINKNFLCDGCHVSSEIVARWRYHSWTNSYITSNDNDAQCNENNAITLQRGESRSMPLFYDAGSLTWWSNLVSLLDEDLDLTLHNIGNADEYAISISLGSGAQNKVDRHKLAITGSSVTLSINDFLHTLQVNYVNPGETLTPTQLLYSLWNQLVAIFPISQTFDDYFNYLLITNNTPISNPQTATFCIEIGNKKSALPKGVVVIKSQWLFGKHRASLQANKNTQLPDFLFSTFIQN